MSNVIELAARAFEDASSESGNQQTLATLQQFQRPLFGDIYAALAGVDVAEDVFITSAAGHIGKEFELSAVQLAAWIAAYPYGVAWPITVAAKTEPDLIPVPLRILIMVPLDTISRNLRVPRALISAMVPNLNTIIGSELNPGCSAVFLGLQCDDSGEWEYGAVAGLLSIVTGSIFLSPIGLIYDLILARAKVDGLELSEVANLMLQESLYAELGFVLSAITKKADRSD